jgi:uncharacterized membrane protein
VVGLVFQAFRDFLVKYFVEPGYDWVDTPTYGLILGVLVLFGVIPVLKRLNVRLDSRFFMAVAPYVVFGSTARELVDRNLGVYAGFGAYPANFWLVSPWIFFTVFFIAFFCLAVSLLASRAFKGVSYHIPMFALGFVLSSYNIALILLYLKRIEPLVLMLAVFGLFMAVIYYASRVKPLSFIKNEGNLWVIGAHMFDASATFIGMSTLGFGEQHVLPSLLINYFGTPAVMFPLKLVVLLPALYLIERDLKGDETARRFLKFVIFVLGFGPGLRDLVMMIL